VRRLLGWICYLLGGGLAIYSLQLAIECEIISHVVGQANNYRSDFWGFLFQTKGQHRAIASGYVIHWIRDISIFLLGALIIRTGREQFIQRGEILSEKSQMVACPGCRRKTFPNAYCRFCGFNLITSEPSQEPPVFTPVWKVTLLAYAVLSLVLIVLNILLIKLGLA
jgi:hypothetical protein